MLALTLAYLMLKKVIDNLSKLLIFVSSLKLPHNSDIETHFLSRLDLLNSARYRI